MGDSDRHTVTVDDEGGITFPDAVLDELDLDPPADVKIIEREDGSFAVEEIEDSDDGDARGENPGETLPETADDESESGLGQLMTREEIIDENRDRGLRRRDELDVEDSGS